ncbi:glycosyl hydrolase 2 galactose-binding domain-containing protein [Actinophytocola sp.]|uniref:glycosyl hydrolase 2 galactose-binding domain-containing protein n=1 Tax=Actinophytocola sp. TaxID=1872138 RepID=UPI003D6BFF7B
MYRTRPHAPEPAPGERAFLEFDGIDHAGTVHLDGQRIARHEGMFVPLVVDLPPGEERVLRCRRDGVPPARRRVRLDGRNVDSRVLTEP